MKGLLSFFILMLLLQADAYPQKIKPGDGFPDSIICSLKQKEHLSSLSGKKPFNKIYNHLPKIPAEYTSGSLVYRPTEIVVDTSYRSICIYDSKGNLISARSEIFKDGLWEMAQRTAYKYDSEDNLLTESLYNWSDNYWKNYCRYIYIYDENSNMISFYTEQLHDTVWVKTSREFYTYDINGRHLSHTVEQLLNNNWWGIYRENWSYGDNGMTVLIAEIFKDGAWAKARRITKKFDSTGNELSSLEERWLNDAWVEDYSCVYTYDSRGNRTSEVSENWTNGIFHGSSRITYTYDDKGSCISMLNEFWRDSTFVKYLLTTGKFDEAGAPLEILTQQWDGSDWDNSYKIRYTYDSNGNAVIGESFRWNGGAWEYVSYSPDEFDFCYNKGKDHLNFSGAIVRIKYELMSVEDSPSVLEFTLLQNYPNPFNPYTAINYVIKKEGRVRLSVYDILGKQVAVVVDEYKTAGSYSVRFDGSSFPSGVYIYRLEAGVYTASKKFILMK